MRVLHEDDAKATEPVLVREDGEVATVTLNRPEKRNALSLEMMEELTAVLERLGSERRVRSIVLDALGPAFCAGHDLSEMVGRDLDFYQRLFDVCTVLMETIHRVPQPVIAKVHGIATAAGCQLVAQCDLAVASDDAKFAVSGINVGLFCSTPSVALGRNVLRKQAMEMLMTGDFIDAAAAVERGLINRAVPADQLDAAVTELARKIVSKSAVAVATGKQMFYRQLEMGLDGAYQYAAEVMACNMMAEDVGEGIDAFATKRTPVWKGK